MNAFPGMQSHPHFVAIPDPARTEGLRAYREPAEPHPLQLTFLEAEGAKAWTDDMRALLAAGRAAEADARLSAALDGFDGTLARMCRALGPDAVALEGWDDLLPILAEWEGPPVTAITLGLTNPPDLVFEGGEAHEPEVLLGLYSDEAYPFTTATEADLLAECEKEMPGWIGRDEDVEFYCGASGLAELNTALIRSRHRHFLRDGRDGVEGRAPGGHVEFVLGCWLMATRFLQAAQRAAEKLPAGCRIIAGTVGLNADFVAILGTPSPATARPKTDASAPQPQFASLTMKPWVPREDPTVDAPPSAPTFRQRMVPTEPEIVDEPRQSLLARLLRRFRRD